MYNDYMCAVDLGVLYNAEFHLSNHDIVIWPVMANLTLGVHAQRGS